MRPRARARREGLGSDKSAARNDASPLFPPVRAPMLQCLREMVRFAGAPFWGAVLLKLLGAVLPVGFVYLQAHGPALAESGGLTHLLVVLGAMFVVDAMVDAMVWPLQMNANDRIRARIHQMHQDTVARWPGMGMHEDPELVRMRTQAQQAVDRSAAIRPRSCWSSAC